LTVRGDRDRFYYRIGTRFERHSATPVRHAHGLRPRLPDPRADLLSFRADRDRVYYRIS